MSSLRARQKFARLLSAEQLEKRQLLAGNVQVSLFDGDLLVRGDEAANVFTVERVVGQRGAEGGLVVLPDAETSINGLPAGEPLGLEAVGEPIVLSSRAIASRARRC